MRKPEAYLLDMVEAAYRLATHLAETNQIPHHPSRPRATYLLLSLAIAGLCLSPLSRLICQPAPAAGAG